MLAAKIVGPSGAVTGVERDPKSVKRARERVEMAGLKNVTFVEQDVAEFSSTMQFDAAVGRYILQFLPDPTATLRSLSQCVRPGGIIAFQEQSWIPFVALSSHLALWSAGVSRLYEVGSYFARAAPS